MILNAIQIVIQMTFSFVGTIGYALCINIPRAALITSGVCGSLGWMIYWVLSNFVKSGKVFANLIAALVIGIVSYLCARYKKMPVSLFNIPALVPLVPGATAYQAVRALVFGQIFKGMHLTVLVILIIGAIAMGYILAQLIVDLAFRRHS